MSKADELLRELIACEELRKKVDAGPRIGQPWTSLRDEYHRRDALAWSAARAYLNEKPHEPPTDHLMNTAVETATTAATIGKRYRDASPPHAAAEPEKPVAWYMAIGGRHSIIEWGPKRPDRVGVVEWYPLYGSPSAQPIAREPTEAMYESAWPIYNDRMTCKNIWRAMYDAALKSAGKEST